MYDRASLTETFRPLTGAAYTRSTDLLRVSKAFHCLCAVQLALQNDLKVRPVPPSALLVSAREYLTFN